LLKSLCSRCFSWVAFVATQIVIDCETLVFMLKHEYPVHRVLHTFLGATLAGLATALALMGVRALLRRAAPAVFDSLNRQRPWASSESSSIGLAIGGIIGGASHPLLDGIMHRDVQPFAPWSSSNPLLHVVSPAALHIGCVVLGCVGLVGIVVLRRADRVASPPE
jgi:hypothetical protein